MLVLLTNIVGQEHKRYSVYNKNILVEILRASNYNVILHLH